MYKLSQKMHELLLVKFIIWSPLIQVGVLSVGVFLSFLTALSRKDVSQYLPFISENGAISPEMCIFSLFLIMGSFIGSIFTAARYLLILQKHDESLNMANKISFIVGMLAMFGLAGVAAFPMSTVLPAHLAVAALYFVMSGVYFLLNTFITWKLEGRSKKFFFRGALTLILFGLLLMLVITFPVALKKWHEYNEILPALKRPENKGFGLVLLAAIFEWSTEVVICIFNLTFILDLRNHGLVLYMTPLKNKSISELENSASPTEETVEK